MMNKTILTISTGLFLGFGSIAQIGFGTATPHASAILDVSSSSKGFLPPRLATHSEVSNPAEGLIIFDESDNCLNVYNGSTWINLCNSADSGNQGGNGNGGSGSTNLPRNPFMNLDCNGAFTNIASFGLNAYRVPFEYDNKGHYSFHLGSDSTTFYSNYGHYYDATSPGNEVTYGQRDGMLFGTTPVLAISQQFPGKKWKSFINIDNTTGLPEIMYLLSTDGELKSMVLYEESNANFDQRGTSTTTINPLNDDDVLPDPGTGYADYRFTPYSHIVNDNDASIKFSSMHYGIHHGTSRKHIIFAYDNVGNKFYSLGTNFSYSPTRYHTKLQNYELQRTAPVNNIRESFELREAGVLNDLLSGLSTTFVEGDGKDMTFHNFRYISNQAVMFITSDGYVNVLNGNSLFRTKFPAGIDPISIIGYLTYPVLASDGKLYHMGTYLSQAEYPLNNRSEVFNGNTYNIYENTATLYNSNATAVNNLNFKRVALRNYNNNEYFGLTQDNKLYRFKLKHNSANSADYGILNDYYTEYNSLEVQSFDASLEDAVITTTNGAAVLITTSSNNSFDFPLPVLGAHSNDQSATTFDLDGLPLTTARKNIYKARLIYNCVGN